MLWHDAAVSSPVSGPRIFWRSHPTQLTSESASGSPTGKIVEKDPISPVFQAFLLAKPFEAARFVLGYSLWTPF
jgi:hypothetical protein